jgi:hypothetical protein
VSWRSNTLTQDVDMLCDISAPLKGDSAVEHPCAVRLGDRAKLHAHDG